MSRRSIHRLTTTLLVVLSLLFSQLALANYICAVSPDGARPAMAMPMEDGAPCEGMDADQPTLCFQHCADAAQNFDPLKVPAASVPALIQGLVLPLVLDLEHISAKAAAVRAEAQAPPDPLFLSTLRLRV
jgi:hypothetical protein